MKSWLLFFIILSFVKISQGQIHQSFVIGPDLGIGANFGNSSKLSLGGSVDYVAHITPKLALRLHSGYNKFKGKIYDDYVSFLPVRAGVQGFIYQDIIFAFAEGGVATYKSSNPGSSLTKFSWAIGGGYNQHINEKKTQFIQTSVWFNFFKHNEYLNYTWFNFRLAYGFSFGKKQVKNE